MTENLTAADVLSLIKDIVVNNNQASATVLGDIYEDLGDEFTAIIARKISAIDFKEIVIDELWSIAWRESIDREYICILFNMDTKNINVKYVSYDRLFSLVMEKGLSPHEIYDKLIHAKKQE